MSLPLNSKLVRGAVLSAFLVVAACAKKQDEAEVQHLSTGSYNSVPQTGGCSGQGNDDYVKGGQANDDFKDDNSFEGDEGQGHQAKDDKIDSGKDEFEDDKGSYADDKYREDDLFYEDDDAGQEYFALSASSKCNTPQPKTVWYCEGKGGIFNPSTGPYSSKSQCESKCGYAMKCYERSAK